MGAISTPDHDGEVGLTRSTLTAVLLALVPTLGLAAQSALVIDARGGASIPVGSFQEALGPGTEVGAGPAFGVHFGLRRGSNATIYVGFSQLRFGCDGACPGTGDLVSTSWDLGTRFHVDLGGATPWLRLGVVLDRVEGLENAGGDRRVSDFGIGGEVGAGVLVGRIGRVRFSPAVRYTVMDADFAPGDRLTMRFLVVDLGVVVGF